MFVFANGETVILKGTFLLTLIASAGHVFGVFLKSCYALAGYKYIMTADYMNEHYFFPSSPADILQNLMSAKIAEEIVPRKLLSCTWHWHLPFFMLLQ